MLPLNGHLISYDHKYQFKIYSMSAILKVVAKKKSVNIRNKVNDRHSGLLMTVHLQKGKKKHLCIMNAYQDWNDDSYHVGQQ